MLRALRILLVLSVATALLAVPALPTITVGPMTVAQVRVQLAFAADGDEQWVSEELQGEQTIAGLTWDDVADAPEQAEVRIRVDGAWSRWEPLAIDDEHGPDPDSTEDGAARGGTSPIVIEGADAVQFRVVDDRPPTDLTADLVDVEDPDGRDRTRRPVGQANAAAAEVAIHTRADWGGQDCRAGGGSPSYTEEVRALFVHHTAGHTTYAEADVPGIVRAICAYHVNGRGWSDIGYNALVDRFGGIWEGRAGGIDRGVIGAHTGGFNSLSTGVALIGDHESGGAPTEAALDALARYAAWKLDVHGVDPTATTTVVSRGSSRWAEGRTVTLDTISGHRDASYTACPGRHCYARLDTLRARVQELTGFATYGGWPQATVLPLRNSGPGWVPATFGFYFDAEADWSLAVRNRNGVVVHRASGRGVTAAPTWDGTVNGAPATRGTYTVHIAATRVADGARARDLVHTFYLGGVVGSFDDVSWDNIFRDDIRWLAEQGITTGCNTTHTRFCPDDAVLRGQMAAFLTRAMALPPGPEGVFTDVPPTHLFSRDVAAFVQAGITTGCSRDGTRYCPDGVVTRAQMAAFLVRALDLPPGTGRRFDDVPPDSPFVDEIDRLAAARITTGCTGDGASFCPRDPVTREQMAAFLHRALTR